MEILLAIEKIKISKILSCISQNIIIIIFIIITVVIIINVIVTIITMVIIPMECISLSRAPLHPRETGLMIMRLIRA